MLGSQILPLLIPRVLAILPDIRLVLHQERAVCDMETSWLRFSLIVGQHLPRGSAIYRPMYGISRCVMDFGCRYFPPLNHVSKRAQYHNDGQGSWYLLARHFGQDAQLVQMQFQKLLDRELLELPLTIDSFTSDLATTVSAIGIFFKHFTDGCRGGNSRI